MSSIKGMMNGLLLLSTLFIFGFMAGCKTKVTDEKRRPAQGQDITRQSQLTLKTAVAEDYIPSQGEYSTVSQCPVMGERIVVDKDTRAVKYKGKAYYLCCPKCVADFKANPEQYK